MGYPSVANEQDWGPAWWVFAPIEFDGFIATDEASGPLVFGAGIDIVPYSFRSASA